jgi:flagellar hook-associated protein 2
MSSSYVSSLSSSSAYETVSWESTYSVSGLTGTDYDTYIDALVQEAGFTKEAYEASLADADAAVELIETMTDVISSAQSTLKGLDTPEEFGAYSVSSTGGAFEVTSISDADIGTHTIVVDQLAQYDVWINETDGFADSNDVLATADTTFTFSYAGASHTLDISSGTTLEEFVDQVNSDTDVRDKVTASLINDGSEYHFVLTGAGTGTDNAVTIDGTGTTGLSIAGFINTQTAQNARFKVDGFPSAADEWIERGSNRITDVIDGISFELQDTTGAAGERFTVGYDKETIKENVETFISTINQVLYDFQYITGRIDTDEEEEDSATYTLNNSTLDLVYDCLKNDLSTRALGFIPYDADAGTGDLYSVLSAIGISTDADEDSDTFGQLVMDETEFDEVLDNNPKAVISLFSANAEAYSDSSGVSVTSVVQTMTGAGEYDIEYTVSGGVVTAATIDGVDMRITDGNTLLAGADSKATGLLLTVNDLTDGTYSCNVYVKQGKIGELAESLEAVIDSDSGTFPILLENYEKTASGLEDKILLEEERLERYQNSLQRRFANLESVLANYESIQQTIENAFSSSD